MNATVTECGTVLDWLWAVGEKADKDAKMEQIPRRSTPRNDKRAGSLPHPTFTKRRGELAEVEALCGRERSGSPQPKSREQRGTSPEYMPNHTKRRGELAEAAFLAKAASMGIGVAKPWGDSDRYDFIIDAGGRLLKVQIEAFCGRLSPQPKS